MKRIFLISMILASLLLSACGNSSTPQSTLTPTPAVTQPGTSPSVYLSTPTSVLSPTPTLTAKPAPTLTAPPAQSPTVTPAPTPSQTIAPISTPTPSQTLMPTPSPTSVPSPTPAPSSTTIPTLVSINVTAPTNLALGTSQQLTATGKYSDGSTKDLTGEANWHSSRPDVVAMVPGGLANTVIIGSANITASVGNIVSPEITVTVNALLSLKVTPSNPTVSVGQTLQLTVTGIYGGGFTQDLTPKAKWVSFNTLLATISAGGLVTGIAPGNVNITATVGPMTSAYTILTVTPSQK